MKPNREPQIACPAQRQAKENSDPRGCRQPNPALPRIPKMNRAEGTRQQHRSWPEPNPLRHRVERVPAQQELFEQSHQHEVNRPEQCEPENSPAMQHGMSEIKCMKAAQPDNSNADRRQSP